VEQALEDTLALKSLLVALWLLCFFAAERLLPAAKSELQGWQAAGLRRLARNLGLWIMNLGLSPLVVLPLTAAASAAALNWRPEGWQGLAALLLDLLILDFLIYWWHRANHQVPFLWRFHAVHHLDNTLDTTSALRFHFGEVILSALFRAAVVFLLGIPFEHIVAFETLVLLAAIFHHSNIRLALPIESALSRVLITPGIHWVHHHAVRRDTDSNYGTLLVFWDRIFASRSPNARRLDMAIGVEREAEESLAGLLIRPFRRQRPASEIT
jgi:sterol desaturase/sphingolipid hydroxylase (fatty acid hydroxylase superfamily)